MPADFAAALARSASRLAMAANSAFSAAAKAGSRRSLILATPRMPQRRRWFMAAPAAGRLGARLADVHGGDRLPALEVERQRIADGQGERRAGPGGGGGHTPAATAE